jgi:hypothetical protein
MVERQFPSWWSIAQWFNGIVLLSFGHFWISLMAWELIHLELGLTPSGDVAAIFLYPLACITSPIALIAIIGGWFFVLYRPNKTRRRI